MTRISVSRQARGLTRQLATLPWKMWSRQAWLQPMQVLISSALPCRAFHHEGRVRQKGARHGNQIRITAGSQGQCSATSGVLIRLLVTRGMETAPLEPAGDPGECGPWEPCWRWWECGPRASRCPC